MTRLAPIALALILAGCAVLSEKISATTGTTLEMRCVDYKTSVAALHIRQRQGNLSAGEADWLQIGEAFLLAYCPQTRG